MIVSELKIKKMLANYCRIREDRSMRERVQTSVRHKDGISYNMLDMVELKEAINGLPMDVRNVAIMCWVKDSPVDETCDKLGIGRTKYYDLKKEAIGMIYMEMNKTWFEMLDAAGLPYKKM